MQLHINQEDLGNIEILLENKGAKSVRETYLELANGESERRAGEFWEEEEVGIGFHHTRVLHPKQTTTVCTIKPTKVDNFQATLYCEGSEPKRWLFQVSDGKLSAVPREIKYMKDKDDFEEELIPAYD